jgi:hypothetical protein
MEDRCYVQRENELEESCNFDGGVHVNRPLNSILCNQYLMPPPKLSSTSWLYKVCAFTDVRTLVDVTAGTRRQS